MGLRLKVTAETLRKSTSVSDLAALVVDHVTVERKHGSPFTVRLFTKVIFSANHLPVAFENSEAYYGRWHIVPFPNTFANNPRIVRELIDNVTRPKEISGFFNKTLKALPKVLSEGITESDSMKQVMRTFRGSDQLEFWLNQETVENPEGFIEINALREAFNQDTHSGMRPQAFGRRLRAFVRMSMCHSGGSMATWFWVYTGLKFQSPRVSLV